MTCRSDRADELIITQYLGTVWYHCIIVSLWELYSPSVHIGISSVDIVMWSNDTHRFRFRSRRGDWE